MSTLSRKFFILLPSHIKLLLLQVVKFTLRSSNIGWGAGWF